VNIPRLGRDPSGKIPDMDENPYQSPETRLPTLPKRKLLRAGDVVFLLIMAIIGILAALNSLVSP
jgi:hypothetical protein